MYIIFTESTAQVMSLCIENLIIFEVQFTGNIDLYYNPLRMNVGTRRQWRATASIAKIQKNRFTCWCVCIEEFSFEVVIKLDSAEAPEDPVEQLQYVN